MYQSNKDILISKKLTGELSSVEADEFEALCASDPSFALESDHAQNIWALSGSYTPQVNPQNSWSVLAQAINVPPPKTKFLTFPLKVAASLILLLGTWFAFDQFYAGTSEFNTIVAEHSNQQVEFNDGSMVWLNQNAKLTYPNNFNRQDRKVQLEGEAFFDITKSEVPFIIETQTGLVEVLGTTFEVEAEVNTTEVTVATGKVKLASNQSDKSIILLPNYQGKHDKNNQQLTMVKASNLDDLSWHTGSFSFNQDKLSVVVDKLSNHFEVDIRIDNRDMLSCTYTSPLTSPDLSETIAVLARTFDFDVVETESGFTLNQGECK